MDLNWLNIHSSCKYLSLDHLNSLSPHTLEVLEDTQGPLPPHLLYGQVQEDEGTSPPHPGTAVDQEGRGQGGGVFLADATDEGDEGHGVARDSVVRPGSVEHVGDSQLSFFVCCLESRDQWDRRKCGINACKKCAWGDQLEVFLENCIINRMRQGGG